MAASTNSDKLKQVYDLYVSKGLIQKTDFNTFSKATDDQKKKLYDLGTKEGLFKTTDYNTFSTAWVKKKDQGVSRVETPKPATTPVSKTGSVPTQPTSGSKPSQGRFIADGGTVSEADKQALLKFASKPFEEQRGTGESVPYKSIEERSKQIRDERAAAEVREAKGNVLEQKPVEEKGPTLLSEQEYQAKLKREQDKYNEQVQGVMSYLKTSPKDLIFDEDALNEDIDYLRKTRGYSDQVIMAGIEEYKNIQQQKKSDRYISQQYESTINEMQMNPNLPEEEKRRLAEGRVFSKALQAGVETMSPDERKAYVMLGDLKKVTEQLNADPGNNALIAKSAELKQNIGGLLDNDKMLFDPVTGELVDKPNPNTEKYQAEVEAGAAKLKSENTEDKLAKIYMNKYATFKYWDSLYDKNQRSLASGFTLGVSPDEFKNKQIREAKTIKDSWIKAKKEFDVAKKSYLLNRDPSGVERDYGFKAAGEVFLETITPQVVQDMLPEGMLPTTDKVFLEIVQNQLTKGGVEITPAMKARFQKSLTEEIVEGTGGLMGILPKLWLAGRLVEGASILTTLDDAIIAMRNGNAFDKSISFILRGALEEAKTQTAGFAPGVGVGFQVAGETIRLPRLKGKFGTILQPALDAAVAGSVGGTVGTELGEVIAKTVDTLGTNQDWNEKMDELFPDFDTVERRIVTNLIINGLFGIAHMPKGSLTFSPEKLMEMSRKMKDKGRREEADYLAKRAAELSGYQKIDMQIARGATGVAGRKDMQEQRPVVAEPKAPAPAAPAPKAEEAAPAPAPKPAPKPVTEAKPKEKSPITVAQSIESGRVYDRDGEKGVLKQEGQIVVLEKSNGDVIELGNIDQVKDQSISDFNIKETTDIKLNDDNSFEVDGKTYVNNYSTPDSAISVDKDGNYSVTLDTPDGKKRTFRGDRGEEMAYQIRLKQLENAKNEQSIDRAIELADEAIAAEGKTGEIAPKEEARDIEQVITESGRKAESIEDAKAAFSEGKDVYVIDEMTEQPTRIKSVTELDVYQPDQVSIIEAKPEAVKEGETVKPKTDAVQVKTAGEVPVQPEAGVGEKVEKRKPKAKPEKVAQKGVEEEVAPKEEGKIDVKLIDDLGFKLVTDAEKSELIPSQQGKVISGEASSIDSFKKGDFIIDSYSGKVYEIINEKEGTGGKKVYDLRDVKTGKTISETYRSGSARDIWQKVENTEPLKGAEVKSTEEPVTTAEKPAAETKPLKPTETTKETVAEQGGEVSKKQAEERLKGLARNFYDTFNEITKDGVAIVNNKRENSTFSVIIDPVKGQKIDDYKSKVKEWASSQGLKFDGESFDQAKKRDTLNFSFGPEPRAESAAKGEFWTNEKAFSVQPKVGDIVDFDGKKHEVLQKTKVGKEQKYLLKEQPKAEEPAPDAAEFLNEKLGLGKSKKPKAKEPAPKVEEPVAKVEEQVAKTTEQKIEEAQKFVDDAAAWLKEKLKIDTLPPDTKAMGITSDALIDVAADAVKKLVATGIKTADAIKQVVDALREGGFLKDIDEKSFAGRLESGKTAGGIAWQKVVPGRGDKNISARNPVVTQAAKELLNGRITNEQYRDIVEQNASIGPITRFFEPATEQQVKDALTKEKVKNANKPIENGAKVGLRVDIPAFTDNNVWVVSVHEGHSKKSPVLSYTSVAMINNVSFGAAPNETIKMAAGSYKDAVQKMYGEWVDIPGKTLAEKAEYAKKMVEDIVNSNNPEWVQVGVNPFRHSFFYDRNRDLGRPLISADQAIQIGGLVYAKNPVYGKWTDAAYRVKGLLDAAGKEVRFSKRTGEPEGAKPVDIKEKEIIEEMNSMDLVNKGVSIDMKSTTDKKINTEELNSSLDTPLEVVDFKNYEGIPFIFTISDQLRTGDIVNPFTGEVISDLKGGLGFNGTKGNENAAWANTTAAEGNATVERAMYVYNKNKALFDKLWKEGRLPDGHIPMAVVKMGESSILSNEAVFRMGIQNVQTLPMSNRNKATVVLKQTLKGKIAETKRLIAKGADPKTGEEYSENTMNSKKKQLAQYENILDILNQNKYKDIVDVLKDNKNFSLPEKAIIINQVFYGVPTTIGGKPIDISRSKAKTPVSKALIGNKNPELINIGRITDLLTEPSMKEIPSMHIISIVAVDVKNPGLVKTTHPNYEFGPRGKSIGVLEQPIHMKDAFGEAYGSVVSKVAKNEAKDKSITPTQALQQGIPVQSGLPNKVYQAAIAKGRLDAVDKLAGFVRQAFPKTTFFTSKEAWETIVSDPSVKKQMKDGDIVYGITADGQVYLNPNLKNTKVLLHESGHIWEDFVKENNPKLWEKGESLVSNTKELAEAQKVYGDTPRARSEAIMEIMSTKGDTIVNAAQKADFKEWMVGLWKYISDKFSSLLGLSPKEIENLTLDKFVEGMLADILSGKELKAGKHVADTKPSKAEMAENAKFSKEGTTPTATERQIAEAERTIDNAAAWLKDKLKVTGLPEGTQKMGMSQEDLIDLVAVAAKKLVTKGIKVNQAIKQAIDALRAGGFLTNMDEKEISKASRRRMSPTYETDMFKVHTLLVDTAKDYIANGGTSRSEFARQMGVKEKNVEQAWDEATGVKTYNKDQIDRRLADISKTAILRGMNVRQRLEEVLANSSNINASIQTFLRKMELYGVVNPVQVKALTSRAAKVKNANQLDKFLEYAEKVFNDANYAKDMADIRSMQEAARRVKHTGNTKAVKEFTSINPERIPENRMDEYMQALDEISGRVPDYSTMQRIYFDIVGQTSKAKDFSNVTTFNKASEIFDNIMSNEIKTVEDYRKLFADINGLKRRLKQLVENDTITMDEYDAIMDNIGKTTADVKNRFAGKIDGLKNELIDEIRSKTFDYEAQNKEEQRIIDAFKEQSDGDLRRLEPEDLWEMNELIDRANDGNFDFYRWNGVVAEAEKMRRGELIGEQLKDAKRLDRADAQNKLAKQESTFIEGTLGLGRSQAGAVSKYIVSEVERAAGSYNVGIKDGLNVLMKAKGKLDKESMNKIGMIVTYLQEYMAQFNPKWSNTQNIGTRDWFGEMLKNPDAMDAYASEKVDMGLLSREKTKAELIQKIYDSLPKDQNGNVDPKAVYESIMSKDGRFLNSKEQKMLDEMMEYIDANIQPKQEASNFSRGMDFEALSFYMPRIDLTDKMDIEAKVDMSRNRVRIKSGFGEERKSQEVRPIETDFEVAITRAIEAANRDYYFGKALDMVNGTLGYAAKAGGSSKNMATIIATNIKDMMEFEFARKQSDAAATVGGLILSARAAQTLLDPVRTVLVELPATFLQVPLRSKNVSGYVDILNPTNGKLFQDLLEFSESPLRLRENISRAIDIDQGAIKPQAMKDKALAFLAGAPERITMIGSWMPSFKNEFKRITGESFDAKRFQTDANYRKKYSRAIKEAASSADMTTQKIIGVTTKLSQARELEMPFFKKGPSKDEFWGKTLGFFGNYPRREYLEFVNGFKEIGERYRNGEGISSMSSISKPLSVALGTLTYGYMASLVYALKQYYFGTEDEKKKADEALARMSSTVGVVEEAQSQAIALAGSKYYSVGRFLTSGMMLVAYNNVEDPEAKKKIARLYKNAYFADPIDPDASKTFSSKDNKEKMALHTIRFIPQLSLAVDKFQQGLEAYGGYEKLMDRHDSVGYDGLTMDEKDLWLLGDIILKAGGIVANFYGTAIPMEKTLQMYVRGNLEVAPMSKEDVGDIMEQRYQSRVKTPEERKVSFEERIKRRKREMELRKLSKEYGVRYRKQ